MTRRLRTIHRVGWLLLAAALAVGLTLALGVRPDSPHDPSAEPVAQPASGTDGSGAR